MVKATNKYVASCFAKYPWHPQQEATAISPHSLTPQPKPPIEDVLASLGELTGDGVTFCYVTCTLSNEFWGFERDGFEARAKELGVEYKTFDVTDESSITKQLDKAKSAANQACHSILALPISATGLETACLAP